MRVFVTGATGFIGSALVPELIAAGHEVVGLARSDAGAAALAAAGAQVQRGALEDVAALQAAAARSDGVVHLAFNHDFSRYFENCEDDRRTIAALGGVLAGSSRPLVVTSGTGMGRAAAGRPLSEDDPRVSAAETPRAATEEAAAAALAAGANVIIVRLPQVHDMTKAGLVSAAIEIAREKGVFPYVGAGENRWPAAHVSDVARLYRLALEKAQAGAVYHAVGEEGVSTRAIAEAVAPRLSLPVRSITPEEAGGHFGWLAMFAGLDLPASSAQTQAALGWRPTGPGLIEDLERFEPAAA